MIWFLIALALTIAAFIFIAVADKDWGGAAGVAAFVALCGGVVAIFLAFLVGAFVYDAETYSYNFDVMAAKDGAEIQGQFGIFGGYIDEEAYYFFYRKHADGRIEQGRIPAGQTGIYQDQETRAYIRVTKSESQFEFWGFTPGDETSYEIHVPEGSVVQDVEFDLE